jgi:hypothetical protein
MLRLSAPEAAYANAALFIALVRKLIDKGGISKEDMSRIVDEVGVLLSQGDAVAMRQALQSLRWFRRISESKVRQRKARRAPLLSLCINSHERCPSPRKMAARCAQFLKRANIWPR